MRTTQTDLLERRKRHHQALETLALTVHCQTPGLKLWRRLMALERKVYTACEAYSNDSSFGIERWQAVKNEARAELREIFGGSIPVGVFINGDPRGHMLKLDNDVVLIPEGMERDCGGNGILAAVID